MPVDNVMIFFLGGGGLMVNYIHIHNNCSALFVGYFNHKELVSFQTGIVMYSDI